MTKYAPVLRMWPQGADAHVRPDRFRSRPDTNPYLLPMHFLYDPNLGEARQNTRRRRSMRTQVMWLCAALLAVGSMVGCKREGGSNSAGGGGGTATSQSSDKQLRLAFVTNNASDFWTIARAGCTK